MTRPPASPPPAGGRARLRADASALARRTGWGYFPVAFVGRLPFAMMIVGVLTLVVSYRGSVADGGLVAAAAGIGTAMSGTLVGSVADRVGQRGVLLASGAISVLAASALLWATSSGSPIVALAAIAVVLGGSTPQVAPFSRSRLVVVVRSAVAGLRRERGLSYVMSYESVMDEVSFVLGPVLVGLLTALIHPWAPLAASILLTVTIVVAFALHPTSRVNARSPGPQLSSRPHATPRRAAAPRSVFSGRILLLVAAMLMVGGVFGSILTAVTAFMVERGVGAQAGIVYGAMSLGAIAVAIAVAALPSRFDLPLRWVVFGALSLAACVALALVGSIGGAVVALVFSGCGIGAVLVGLFSLGSIAAPEGRSTTVLTTLQSTLVVGQSLATAAGGAIVDASGSAAGYWVSVAFGAVLIVLGVIYRAAFGLSPSTVERSPIATP